jgi:protein-tyrosine phosphatase
MPAFLQLNSKGKLLGLASLFGPDLEIQEIHDSFMELARLENERIAEKFKNPSMDAQWARLDPDPTRDRYVNVHPWANNRVHLKVPKGYNDYINASPITLVPTSGVQGQARTGSQHKYICMQGPKRETVDHVWHSKYPARTTIDLIANYYSGMA